MGRGADSEAAAAGAGPPSRRNEKEEGPSPPQLPPPREAAPTFLQAQDAVWAARDSETLSALPSPRTRSSAPRQPVTAPSSLREVPEPIAPRVGPCLPQAEVEALAPAAAPLQVPRSPSRRQVPQHGLLSPLWVVPGVAEAPALPAGSGGGGWAESWPGLRCSARLAPPLLPLPPALSGLLPPLPARALPFLPLRSAQPRRHMSARYGDDDGGGGGGRTRRTLSTRLLGPARTAATLNRTTGRRWQTSLRDLGTWRAEWRYAACEREGERRRVARASGKRLPRAVILPPGGFCAGALCEALELALLWRRRGLSRGGQWRRPLGTWTWGGLRGICYPVFMVIRYRRVFLSCLAVDWVFTQHHCPPEVHPTGRLKCP